MANSDGTVDRSNTSGPEHLNVPEGKFGDGHDDLPTPRMAMAQKLSPNPATYVDRLRQTAWPKKHSQDAFINGCWESTRPTVAKYHSRMANTQTNFLHPSEEETCVWLTDIQEVQHNIFDQMSILETGIAMLVEELTTINTKNLGLNHNLGQISGLLDHVFPGKPWQMKKP
ncbi:hypothetical protein BC943DRAFT_324867 [Umbelopsis sp. AD052]|nr:hypothetical protein BC943DRAFT_324867 [Umbelopsis sp. AD052]